MVKLSALLRDVAIATATTAILAIAFSSVVHSSEASADRGAARQACANDVRTLCSGVFPGGGRIRQCMIEKYAQLSDGCKNAMAQARALSQRK